jgi:predicted nucleotidyltransferase component of viral defense system
MIPQAYINEWRDHAPWPGGDTALHKLFIQPAARYSEDIDLVQVFCKEVI